MICGPEVSRIAMRFEVLKQIRKTEYKHHKETVVLQKCFKTRMDCLIMEVNNIGNLLITSDKDCALVQPGTRAVMGPNIVKSINEIERVGKEQADQFMKKH